MLERRISLNARKTVLTHVYWHRLRQPASMDIALLANPKCEVEIADRYCPPTLVTRTSSAASNSTVLCNTIERNKLRCSRLLVIREHESIIADQKVLYPWQHQAASHRALLSQCRLPAAAKLRSAAATRGC
jgi:hypothetical protein